MVNTQGETWTFEDLEIWQQGRKLRQDISKMTNDFPKGEKYNLTNQMNRAARSVTANIAEGYGRYHYQENVQFCRQARGSLFELLDHLTVALDEYYIDHENYQEYKSKISNLVKKINGYIKYLKSRQSN